MLSKEEFVKYLNFIKIKREQEQEFVKVLEKLSPGTYCDCYLYDEYESKIVNLLENIFEDGAHDISYFIYDLNGLEKLDKKRCPKENKKYLYTSIETLYDYLVGEMSK